MNLPPLKDYETDVSTVLPFVRAIVFVITPSHLKRNVLKQRLRAVSLMEEP